MQASKSNRGETLIEVIIALTVLIMGTVGSLHLLGVAGKNNQITKEKVLATDLAREGIEAVRSIRDTNWLRFAGERRVCWNNLDSNACNDVNNDGVADTPIENNRAYIAKLDLGNFRWQLSDGGISDRLNLGDGEIANDAVYRLKLNPVTGLYSHTGGDDSPYYREIYTEYLEANQSAASASGANILRVTARVQWLDRGQLGEITLTAIITDYLGRQNHL